MSYKIVIVDDEPLAIEVLKHHLKEEKDFTIAAAFTNPHEALEFINNNVIDLLLLDMQMSTLNGLELLRQIQTKPLVIFTTAHKEYLQAGFDNGILDYLQKPINQERLLMAIERARKHLNSNSYADNAGKIYVKSGDKEIPIALKNVLFIKSARDYCTLFLTNNKKLLIKTSLEAIQEKLETSNEFYRVHRSYIIPLSKIEMIKSNKTIIIQQHEIPIGRNYKKDFNSKVESFKI